MSMTRRQFMRTATLSALAAAPIAPKAVLARRAERRRPNVIYIMTDQQRKDTLGCYSNPKARTPALDKLAAEGTLFTSCYTTQPVCSPCRSSMVTGLFPNVTGVVENKIPLPAKLFSWPRALGQAGYKVGYIGKWHLGTDPVADYFDFWRGFQTGWNHWVKKEPFFPQPGESQTAFEKKLKDKLVDAAPRQSRIGRYRPDVETDYAIEFITANRNEPFVCWLSFYPPHTPKTVPEENLALFRGKFESKEQDIYYAMVNRLDANIARLMRTVEALGLRENTVVVFTSDHGENFPHRWNKHHKRLCYDQSANVPLIVSWPGVLPEGKRIDNIISIADLAPTILDLCDVGWPDTLHGKSAKRLLAGDASDWHEDIYMQNTPYPEKAKNKAGADIEMRERCVITNRWKLILNTSRKPELYDRTSPTPDKANLFNKPESKKVIADLTRRLAAWGKKTGDKMTAQLIRQWQSR